MGDNTSIPGPDAEQPIASGLSDSSGPVENTLTLTDTQRNGSITGIGIVLGFSLTFAMIETRMALENLDSIAGTEGIDALFLGPADLSIALSDGRTLDPMGRDVDESLDHILAAADKAGKFVGAYCHTPERAVALAKRGVKYLAVQNDMAFLRAGVSAAMRILKAG